MPQLLCFLCGEEVESIFSEHCWFCFCFFSAFSYCGRMVLNVHFNTFKSEVMRQRKESLTSKTSPGLVRGFAPEFIPSYVEEHKADLQTSTESSPALYTSFHLYSICHAVRV